MIRQEDCNAANQALHEHAVGGYAHLHAYNGNFLVTLDGDFDLEDLKRLVQCMEQVQEEALK